MFGHDGGFHPDDAVKYSEHAAVLNYVDYAKATHVVEGPTSRLDLPPRSRLVVPKDRTLTVDSDTSWLNVDWLRVDGQLEWIHRPAKLRVTTLVLTPPAKCLCEPSSFLREIAISARGPRNREDDPSDISGGIISHCKKFELAGEEKTEIAQPLALVVGRVDVQLESPVFNWNPGDKVLISGVEYSDPDEILTIESVSGTFVRFTTPIQFNHQEPDGSWPAIGNLNRTFHVYSENVELSQRGHFMVMHEHQGTSLKHVSFMRMGRTDAQSRPTKILLGHQGEFVSGDENTVGRYPVHFHGRTGMSWDVGPHVVDGCVILGSPLHGLVNHGMHVEVKNCITYYCDGSGLFTENGHELGSFKNNLCVFSKGRQTSFARTTEFAHENFGFEGHGIWLQGPGVEVHGNHCYRHKRDFIELIATAHAEVGQNYKVANVKDGPAKQKWLAEGRTTIPISMVPTSITGNVGSGAKFGLFCQEHLFSFLDTESQYTDLTGNQFYNVDAGIGGHYIGHLDIKDCLLYGNMKIQNSLSFAGVFDLVNSKNIRVSNTHVEGFHVGILDPGQGTLEVENCTFKNNVMDIVIRQQQTPSPHNVFISGITRLGRAEMEAKYNATDPAARAGSPVDYWFQIVYAQPQANFTANLFVASEHRINGKLIYYPQNAHDFVPFVAAAHPEYGGKTNEQLFHQFGFIFMGRYYEDLSGLEVLEGANTLVYIEKSNETLTLEERISKLESDVREIKVQIQS